MQTYHDFVPIPSQAEVSDPDMREYVEMCITSLSNIGIANTYHLFDKYRENQYADTLCDMLVAEADRRLGFARHNTPDF